MPHFVLLYDYIEDNVARRAPIRPAHLALVNDAHSRGELVMAGPLGDPHEGALLIFNVDHREAVEQFVQRDPYVQHGVVTRWRIVPWTVVSGGA
ncbi:MAG: YciI family protein [Acidobacteriaceae bacterium]|jgi:uncharacterized protein YciI|nr:YciI family protein [Acidobacteriaceae bacterium]